MTDATTYGTYGAKRQTQKTANPRNHLKRMMDNHPKASEADLLKMFTLEVRDQPEMIDAIIEYWFANNYRSLSWSAPPAPVREAKQQEREVARAAKEAATEAVKAVIKERATKMVMLEMIMTNGKALADCTFKEVAAFGSKFLNLSKAGKPNEKVGKLSETEVRKLLK